MCVFNRCVNRRACLLSRSNLSHRNAKWLKLYTVLRACHLSLRWGYHQRAQRTVRISDRSEIERNRMRFRAHVEGDDDRVLAVRSSAEKTEDILVFWIQGGIAAQP